MEKFNEILREKLSVGLAVVDRHSREIVFGNASFATWVSLETTPSRRIDELLPKIDFMKMERQFAFKEPYELETSTKVKRREVCLDIKIVECQTDEDMLILEAQNVTKIRELEYLIESYTRMNDRQVYMLKREKERVERILRELNVDPEGDILEDPSRRIVEKVG